ncbi:hypothetical protein Acr_21g0008140 [Actinidia rufa]|uniref:Bulb-type lectin domain-containing protein n=1 Tax=Actinidia rufa TaxID=165716 RepID=A0A7J0GHG3_9ERIC|nr:hypothetical protein Acr_21g0008140 [Actinidia rufa]
MDFLTLLLSHLLSLRHCIFINTFQHSLSGGSSLSVERYSTDVLVSPNRVFVAGFYAVGDNAFVLAVWFAQPSSPSATVVWMANRDQPVNGKGSKLSLQKKRQSHLVRRRQNHPVDHRHHLRHLRGIKAPQHRFLASAGNLVLTRLESDHILWQSFDSPTDTLLPHQMLTRYTSLSSSRSQTDHSSGIHKLFFDNDNALKLLYTGPQVSSIYWPDPWLMIWDTGRTTYNSSQIAILDPLGHFRSSDNLQFSAADFGLGPQRRLTLDFDGNLRLYSLDEMKGNWTVTWQAISDPCRVHGLCGPNSICSYGSGAGRGCSLCAGELLKWYVYSRCVIFVFRIPKRSGAAMQGDGGGGGGANSGFSRMRGTRGYMAPEWVFNLPITSKVDVYGYGIVVLEMITGKSPLGAYTAFDGEEEENRSLVSWVKKKMQGAASEASWIEEIVGPIMSGGYDMNKMGTLVRVAMQCVEEDRERRPTMKEVVEMLLCHEDI